MLKFPDKWHEDIFSRGLGIMQDRCNGEWYRYIQHYAIYLLPLLGPLGKWHLPDIASDYKNKHHAALAYYAFMVITRQ